MTIFSPDESTEILTVREAARLIKVTEWSIYELIRQNKISYIPIGRRRLIVKKDLLEYLNKIRISNQ